MPRRYFSNRSKLKKHYSYHHYDETPEGIFEDKVDRFVNKIVSIPRRFWAGIKRIIWPY